MSESYIINLITESAKVEIENQINHLESMSKEDEYKERYSAMLQGAKTVIWLLENESIAKQGTYAFLNHLDRDQLEYAISAAKEIKKLKTDIGKVELFGIFGGDKGSEWFYDEGLAKEAYLRAASESLSGPCPEVSFESKKVPAEELEEYLKKDEIGIALGLIEKP